MDSQAVSKQFIFALVLKANTSPQFCLPWAWGRFILQPASLHLLFSPGGVSCASTLIHTLSHGEQSTLPSPWAWAWPEHSEQPEFLICISEPSHPSLPWYIYAGFQDKSRILWEIWVFSVVKKIQLRGVSVTLVNMLMLRHQKNPSKTIKAGKIKSDSFL